jgi:hypothetical protein
MKDNDKCLSLLADRVLIAEDTHDENDVFLTIDLVVCTSKINGNNEGVSKEFIADIVSRNDEFVALPLYADVSRLTAKEYDKLTHLYNRFTGQFETTQIGGLFNYRMITEDGIDYLQATARIPKRESEICECVSEMYEKGLLCFSFEVKYNPADTHLTMQGAQIIDVGPHNVLCGVAIVSKPAYPDSVALDLVAELRENGEPTGERGETMPNEQMNAEQIENPEVEPEQVTIAEGDGDGGDGGGGDSGATGTGTETQGDGTGGTDGNGTGGTGGTDGNGSGGTGGTDGNGSGGTGGTDGNGSGGSGSGSGSGEGSGSGSGSGSGDGGGSGSGGQQQQSATIVVPDAESEDARKTDAMAEVIVHSIETEQTYDAGCPEYDIPPTVRTEVRETVIETVDDTNNAVAEEDEKDRTIAELKNRIAELEEIESKYNAILKAEAEKALAEKQNRAKSFAEKLGLDVNAENVATAISEMNYETLANLSMEQEKVTMAEQEAENETPAQPEVPAYFQMASYVDMDIKDSDEYGDMLRPVSK